jgi:hypothetical protein
MKAKYGILKSINENRWLPYKYNYKSINIKNVGKLLFDLLDYDEQDYVQQMNKYSHLNYDEVIKQYDKDTLPNYIKHENSLGWKCDDQGNIIGFIESEDQ